MAEKPEKPICFVVMPFSDAGPEYTQGHWDRVFTELFKPACEEAGFQPQRADDKRGTSIIIKDVLIELVNAPMVLCDTSGHRSNVFFELGFRQAFNLPVVLVKDELTERPFDIAMLRDVGYSSSLRADLARQEIKAIARALKETFAAPGKAEFSLVKSLGIEKAPALPEAKEGDTLRAILASVNYLASEFETLRRSVGVPTFPSPAAAAHLGLFSGLGDPKLAEALRTHGRKPRTLSSLSELGLLGEPLSAPEAKPEKPPKS